MTALKELAGKVDLGLRSIAGTAKVIAGALEQAQPIAAAADRAIMSTGEMLKKLRKGETK